MYQPILYHNITQRVSIQLTPQNLSGLLIMASVVIDPRRIQIMGPPVDPTPHLNAQSGLPEFTIFSSKQRSIRVYFRSLEFIQGAIYLCMLFGLDWRDHIKGNFVSDTYLGIILIRENYPKLNTSLVRNMWDCFNQPGVHFNPSNLYVASTDPDLNNIVASGAITLKPEGFFVYNVCTYSPYRGKGLMKTTFIYMMNDILQKNPGANIYLEVDPKNISAYRLYQSLGFQKVGTTPKYHLLKFS